MNTETQKLQHKLVHDQRAIIWEQIHIIKKKKRPIMNEE
jgi:hypothetical protein